MIALLASLTVLLTGLYFVLFGILLLAAPARGARFLQSFATSARAHYLELAVRLVIGAAFVVRGPTLWLSPVLVPFGWLLIATTAGLFLVPWQWHSRIAHTSVACAVRYLPLIAIASLAVGGLILAAWMRGS